MFAVNKYAVILAVLASFRLSAAAQVLPSATVNSVYVRAGDWTMRDAGGNFAVIWSSGSKTMSFILTQNEPRFELQFTNFTPGIEEGPIKLVISFDGGKPLFLPARANHDVIVTPLADDELAEWTHAMTAAHVMTIEGLPGGSWIVPLNGTTPTINALSDALSFAGIEGLPRPFDTTIGGLLGNPAPSITQTGFVNEQGYELVIFDQKLLVPDPEAKDNSQTLLLERELPQIISPVSRSAVLFNSSIRRFIDEKSPIPFNPQFDPNMNAKQIAEASDLEGSIGLQNMLPSIVSIAFTNVQWRMDNSYGRFFISMFNWNVAKARQFEPGDIFDLGTDWQDALIQIVDTQQRARRAPASDCTVPLIVDPAFWRIRSDGIFVLTRCIGFYVVATHQLTGSAFVPWASLRPYLSKDGPVGER